MKATLRRRCLAFAVAATAGAPWFQAHVAQSATPSPREVRTILRELILFLQGGPMPVAGAPVLCSKAKPAGAETREWFLGAGGCVLTYAPDPGAMVSTVTEGLWETLASPKFQQGLLVLLEELDGAVRRGGLNLQERLMVQSTAWEIAAGLKQGVVPLNDPSTEQALQRHVCKSLQLMEATRFSVNEITGLPDNLRQLPELAGVPDIAPTVDALLKHDPRIAEVSRFSYLHDSMLLGRFSTRIFLMTDGEADRKALATYLRGPVDYWELGKLAYRFTGLRTVLVLYFNVVTQDGTILPTGQVASWLEYWLAKRVTEEMSWAEAAANVSFREITYRHPIDPGTPRDAGPGYRRIPLDKLARSTFLDVVPPKPRWPVTTLRGHCLACHVSEVQLFATHVRIPVSSSAPFTRPSGRGSLSRDHLEMESKLRQWSEACFSGREAEHR